jgi:uncharacterized protein with GYD domain
MATFITLSKFSLNHPGEVKTMTMIDRELDQRLHKECPEVKRIASYVLLGEYDFLHVFEAPYAPIMAKVALIIQSLGMGSTQTLTAIPFEEFRQIVEEI